MRRYPEVAAPKDPRRPPATLWQPFGLTDPAHRVGSGKPPANPPSGPIQPAGLAEGSRWSFSLPRTTTGKPRRIARAPRRGARVLWGNANLDQARQRPVWHPCRGACPRTPHSGGRSGQRGNDHRLPSGNPPGWPPRVSSHPPPRSPHPRYRLFRAARIRARRR